MVVAGLKELITKALGALDLNASGDIHLEHPDDLTHGDYATSVALALAKSAGQNPRELAEKIAGELNRDKPREVEKIEVASAGFINFYLTPEYWRGVVGQIGEKGDDYGRGEMGKGRKVLVEYSSPNIAKPFGIGHLRSTIIGEAIANLLSFSGYEVIRDNHLGDWGTQFGKMIVALKKWGEIEVAKKSAEPIKYLVGLYVKFHEEAEKDEGLENEGRAWFAKLEQGDAEARSLWQTCVELSIKEFSRIYERLGIHFGTTLGESFFEDKMPAVLAELEEKRLLQTSEGAELVFFAADKYPPLMIKKSDGATLYATRDLATDQYRLKTYGQDLIIINEVGSEQSLYFRQLFEIEKLLGWVTAGQRVHVAHGLIRGTSGKLSTRKGDSIWLGEVLDEAVKRASTFNPESAVAEAVGIGAIKYNDLKRESQNDIIFDWDDILNLQGNSGPYLQYTYARAQAVLRKAEKLGTTWTPGVQVLGHLVSKSSEYQLERWLARFSEVVARAATEYAPHHLATYLYQLASEFNNFYAHEQIIGQADDVATKYRLALTAAVGQVLKNGLCLLGITVPERM